MASIAIDLALRTGGWPTAEVLEGLTAQVIQAAANWLEAEAGQPFPDPAPELSVVFTGDAEIRDLNAGWRGRNKPTNVLSFPVLPCRPGRMPGPMLGDIVLARETIAAEAEEMGISFDAHLSHLLVHGFLHLLGYDHVEDADARLMESLETRILATLCLSDPYAGSDPA